MTTSQLFIRWFSPCGNSDKDVYSSVQEYIDEHQDGYQWDQDENLYVKTPNGFVLL